MAGVLAADEVQKGKSLFKDKIGTKVFSKDVTIMDDGTLIDGLASRPFDGEGVPKGKTLVFDGGVLLTYLYDVNSARKDKKLTTGNAVRASYRSSPQIGVSNFYIKPSGKETENIFEKVNRGFFVTDIIGLHSGTNPISGQISVGAKGFLIKNGSLEAPVKEVTIATDILSFCKNLDKIGKDLKFLPAGGYIGSPSILIKEISVSGD